MWDHVKWGRDSPPPSITYRFRKTTDVGRLTGSEDRQRSCWVPQPLQDWIAAWLACCSHTLLFFWSKSGCIGEHCAIQCGQVPVGQRKVDLESSGSVISKWEFDRYPFKLFKSFSSLIFRKMYNYLQIIQFSILAVKKSTLHQNLKMLKQFFFF